MVGIVVVGHGRLAVEMGQALETVLGPIEAFAAVVTAAGDSPESIHTAIREAVTRVDRGDGVIILTDLFGDTQTNQSLGVARETGAEVVAGVNMPILIKLATSRAGMDARTLAGFIRRYGQDHILWATEQAAPGPQTQPAR
ncbi:MAG: PTS sugar transporter subunit IIA [Candidatus Binatia bacterium]